MPTLDVTMPTKEQFDAAVGTMQKMGLDLYSATHLAAKVTGCDLAVASLHDAAVAYGALPVPRSEPIILPKPPMLVNPGVLTAQKRLTLGGTFSNKRVDPTTPLGLPYVAKDGAAIPSLYFSDHMLDGASGLIRINDGPVGQLTIERISLLKERWLKGQIAGLLHVGGAEVNNVNVSDIDLDRDFMIGSSGDIYALVATLGGHDQYGNVYGSGKNYSFRNIRAKDAFVSYAGEYPNSDFYAIERTFTDGLITDNYLWGASDAGIDCKGVRWRVQRTVVGAARENFKTWEARVDGDVYSHEPRFAHWLITHMTDVHPGVRTEHTTEFARVHSKDPNVPIVAFEKFPGVKRWLEWDFSPCPPGQVLAKCAPEAKGSSIFVGSREIPVNQAIIYMKDVV